MRSHRVWAALAMALVLMLTPLAASPTYAAPTAPPASAAKSSGDNGKVVKYRGKKVVVFDLFYGENVTPWRIFFTANSGPYLKNLKWKGWGTKKAVGRGFYISDCASCGPKRVVRRAKMILLKRTYCATRGVYFYKKAFLVRKNYPPRPRKVRAPTVTCPAPGDSSS